MEAVTAKIMAQTGTDVKISFHGTCFGLSVVGFTSRKDCVI